MPQAAIAAAIQYVGTAWGWSQFAIAVAQVVAAAAYQADRNRSARRKAAAAYNAGLQDRLLMLDVTPNAPAHLVLGKCRFVEGVRRRWQSGEHDEKLTMFVSVAGHEIDGFEQWYVNDTAVELDANGWVITAPWTKVPRRNEHRASVALSGGGARVTSAHPIVPGSAVATVNLGGDNGFAQITVTVEGNDLVLSGGGAASTADLQWQVDVSEPLIRIRPFLGAPGQNVGAAIAAEYPGKITANDRFEGMAGAVVDLIYDTDVFHAGVPSIAPVIRGAKIYDPRLDSTVPGGSGPQRVDQPATWAFSENLALQAYHLARHTQGWDVPAANIRVSDVIAAANECDISTNFSMRMPDGTLTTVTLPRYHGGIVVPTDGDLRGAMNELVEAMAGRWGWAGGVWRLRAGASPAPVFTLGEDWIAQPLDAEGNPRPGAAVNITNGTSREQEINKITGTCVNRNERWQALPFPDVPDDVAIAAEGENPMAVEYQAVNHIAHAQHLARVALRLAQAPLRLQASCNLNAYQVEIFDVGTVVLPRYGFTAEAAKLVEVTGWRWHPTEGIRLSTEETSAAIYDPGELTGLDPAPNGSLPPANYVADVLGFTLAENNATLLRQPDGSVLTRVLASWLPVQGESVRNGGRIEIRWGPANVPESQWQSQFVDGSATQDYLLAPPDGAVIIAKARAINALPARGRWCPQVPHLVVGKTAAPSDLAAPAYDLLPNGQVLVKWPAPTDIDYAEVEWRNIGAGTWASAGASARIFKGRATSFEWAPGFGTHTIAAKVFDTTGNESVNAVTLTFTLNGLVILPFNNFVTVNGTTVTKTGGAAAYDTGAHSREAYSGGAFCAHSPGAAGVRYLAGLNASAGGAQAHYNDIDYQLFVDPGGALAVYENAAFVADVGTWALEDVLSTTYDGRVVAHWKNGTLLHAKVVGPDLTMQFDCSIYSGSIQDIQFGPYSAPPAAGFVAGNAAFASGRFMGKRAGAAAAWDSHVYSGAQFVGGCVASCRPAQNNAYLMFGLNADPTADQSWASIDFAFYAGAGHLEIYEGGVYHGAFGPYSALDHLVVSFDGEFVRYARNGTLLREVEARAYASTPLHFDSSFNSPGALAVDVEFRPVSTATNDLRLIARGPVEVVGRTAKKVGGISQWNDGDVYSVDGYTGGASASVTIVAVSPAMFGLNSDPTADQSWTSIDFAFYVGGVHLEVYESGDYFNIGNLSYSIGDVLAVTYDGYTVRYLQNGVVRRAVVAGTGRKFHFDSAFASPGSTLGNIRFDPMSPVADLVTGQITFGAAADVQTVKVQYDSFTTQATFVVDRTLASWSWTNNVGRAVDIEFSVTSTRKLTASPSLTGTVRAFDFMNLTIDGVAAGPPSDGQYDTLALSAGQSEVWNEATVWAVRVNPGQTVAASSVVRIVPSGTNGAERTVETYNLTVRATVIKA